MNSQPRFALVCETPVGPYRVTSNGESIVGIWSHVAKRIPALDTLPATDDVCRAAARQLQEYFAGERQEFDLPLFLDGTEFNQRVWDALLEIPYGVTWSYGQLAAHIGAPKASRAVGAANGRNPISIVVPCHRVIGSTGRHVGYGGGLPAKAWLLDHEAAHSRQRLPMFL